MEANSVGQVLKVLGIIVIILGLIGGYQLGGMMGYEFNWTLALTGWLMSIINGFVLIGFSEVIHLLQQLVPKIQPTEQKESDQPAETNKSFDINKYKGRGM